MFTDEQHSEARARMVEHQIRSRDVGDEGVLRAMETVPRHEFVPAGALGSVYGDHPLPIGHGQTISQPYIVAYMTEALGVGKGRRVLEIGTGCGYQTAILAHMGVEVFSVEIVEPLLVDARATLDRLGFRVTTRLGDGHQGWPDEAPFDGILVTAAPTRIPEAFVEQLAQGGRLVIPVGETIQDLKIMEKRGGRLETLYNLPVRFVPMVGGGE